MKHTMNMLLIGFAFIGLLAGCSDASESQDSLCIPPNVITNFAPNLQRQNGNLVPNLKPMPSWWAPQLNETQMGKLQSWSNEAVVMRSDNEIWIASLPGGPDDSIVRYRTDTGEIKSYIIRTFAYVGMKA